MLEKDFELLWRVSPRKKVRGDVSFQRELGPRYTFLFNGRVVELTLDGTYQEFPDFVADVLQEKLDKLAQANAAKNVTQKI